MDNILRKAGEVGVMTSGIEQLHAAIARGKREHGIALTSHVCVGYPSLATNHETVEAFVASGVDVMELQFPFSDPVADGPVLTHANQTSVLNGTTVDQVFGFVEEVTRKYPDVAFVAMTYMNIVFRRGVKRFVSEARQSGITGIILPDLPLEEAGEFRKFCESEGIGTIFLVTPTTTSARAQKICDASSGFVFCVGRSGVSGAQTVLSDDLQSFFARTRRQSDVPVAVGFGIRSHEDVAVLQHVTDIAIVSTEANKRVDSNGPREAAAYLATMRRP